MGIDGSETFLDERAPVPSFYGDQALADECSGRGGSAGVQVIFLAWFGCKEELMGRGVEAGWL